ncbi:MAG TPA: oxidoreductase [Candidatus Paceibacterota bacterium]|nr:oxidoreductase [Candidatus Paceibacterota bacterium]
MIALIDRLLNKITMYRLLLYILEAYVVIAAILGALGILPYSPVAILFTAFFLLGSCWIINIIFAKVWGAQPSVESAYLTGLILALIITPGTWALQNIELLLAAALIAMASKYIIAIGKKHVFNPAALAVVITGFALNQYASWWVGGNLPMMAFVIVGGLLIVRKLQRFDLFLSFFAAAIVSCIALAPIFDPWGTIQRIVLHTPIFFFGTIMLTEPLTTPPTRTLRVIYGVIVGLLYSPYVHVGAVYSIPELALVTGNVFSYVVSPKRKFMLTMKGKHEVGKDMDDFQFAPDAKINHRPGQYLEWTLAHQKADTRGNRRYFTIASSPTEPEVHLGVKFYENSSTFKFALMNLKPGETIVAGQLAGDFTLPNDPKKKLIFIAGGIGITPFRSMAKYISDMNERRDAILFYSNRNENEIAYRDIFDEAEKKWGLRTVYAITDPAAKAPSHNGRIGRIDMKLIESVAPDFRERTFYISGTHGMVSEFKKTLAELGVPRTQIKTDFFPGFA